MDNCEICDKDPCECVIITPEPWWQVRFTCSAIDDWVKEAIEEMGEHPALLKFRESVDELRVAAEKETENESS